MQPKRALLVIDVQNEYVTGNLPITYPPTTVSLPNITLAMDTAYVAGIPLIVVQQNAPATSPIFAKDSHGWQLHPDVASRPHTLLVQKNYPSAFHETNLRHWLETHAINTISVAGYMTHNCVASTIIEAAHTGFQAEFLYDAAGSLAYVNAAGNASAEQIHTAYSTVFHTRFAAVAHTDQWVAAVKAQVPLPQSTILQSNSDARQQQH